MTNGERGVVVIGAGGHAAVCVEILRHSGTEVAFAIGADGANGNCIGVPVLGGDFHVEALRAEGFDRAFVAIGSNQLRRKLAGMALGLGYQLVRAISPAASVSPSATIGHGTAVMAGAVINARSTISDLSIVNTGATIDHDCQIGVAVHVAPQCALAGNVTIGEGAFLGIGTTVIPGITIGAHSRLGAGAVAICDIPGDVTAFGVPAVPQFQRIEDL